MIGGSHSLYSEDLEVDLADDGQMSLVSVLGYISILLNSISILFNSINILLNSISILFNSINILLNSISILLSSISTLLNSISILLKYFIHDGALRRVQNIL